MVVIYLLGARLWQQTLTCDNKCRPLDVNNFNCQNQIVDEKISLKKSAMRIWNTNLETHRSKAQN